MKTVRKKTPKRKAAAKAQAKKPATKRKKTARKKAPAVRVRKRAAAVVDIDAVPEVPLQKVTKRVARRRAAAARRAGVPAKWVKLFDLIPGYNPLDWVRDGDWFDVDEAEHVVAFFAARIHHIKGDLAGQPYEMVPYEQAIIGSLMGWKQPDGLRRYRECFWYEPKKNGKTTRMCGLIPYHMTQDGEVGAEIYSAGSKKEQASIVFHYLTKMIAMCPEFQRGKVFEIYGETRGSQQRSIVMPSTNSVYVPLSSDAAGSDGPDVYVAIIDELHRHKDGGALADILQRGMSARRQPMLYTITTAGDDDPESAVNRKLAEAKRVRDNGGDPTKPGYDPTFLPAIFEAPKRCWVKPCEHCDAGENWACPRVWAIANPNLGRSKQMSYMRKSCAKAREHPINLNEFKRFELNIVTSTLESLIPMDLWEQCPTEVDDAELVGRKCYGGLDLAQRDDLAAFCVVWPPVDREGGEWVFRWWCWCPSETIRVRQAGGFNYAIWRDLGLIIECEGNDIDDGQIESTLAELHLAHEIHDVGYDPRGGTLLSKALYDRHGINVEPVAQSPAALAEPTLQLLSLVKSLRCNHGGNYVARWNAGNAMGRRDESNKVIPTKKKSRDKIDLISAAIIAIARALADSDPVVPDSLIACAG